MTCILVGTDLSARSGHAISRAILLARQFGWRVEVMTVVDETFFQDMTRQKAALAEQAIAAQIQAIPDGQGIEVATHVAVGADFEQIIHRADQIQAGLIVLGPHRHGTPEMFRGTTAERVIRHGRRPVLVVRAPATGDYKCAVLGTDLSPHADAAALEAARLVPGGQMHVVHAVHRPFGGFLDESSQQALVDQDSAAARDALQPVLAQIADRMGADAPEVDVILPEGSVGDVLAAQITTSGADLLALGTHGRSGIAHAVLGSVAAGFLATSPVDVLAVRSIAARA